jgi:hypothetical protein
MKMLQKRPGRPAGQVGSVRLQEGGYRAGERKRDIRLRRRDGFYGKRIAEINFAK